MGDVANHNLGVAISQVAFPPDRKKRSVVWHLYILPAHVLRLMAFLSLDARRIIVLRNAGVQFYLSTLIWFASILAGCFLLVSV